MHVEQLSCAVYLPSVLIGCHFSSRSRTHRQRRRSLRIIGGTQKNTGGLEDGSPPAASRGGSLVGGLKVFL